MHTKLSENRLVTSLPFVEPPGDGIQLHANYISAEKTAQRFEVKKKTMFYYVTQILICYCQFVASIRDVRTRRLRHLATKITSDTTFQG
jgi:hypothetical protein